MGAWWERAGRATEGRTGHQGKPLVSRGSIAASYKQLGRLTSTRQGQQHMAGEVCPPARPELPSDAPPTTRTAPLVEPAGAAAGPGGNSPYTIHSDCDIMSSFHEHCLRRHAALHATRAIIVAMALPTRARNHSGAPGTAACAVRHRECK